MEPTTVDYTQSQLNALLTGILDSSELVKLDNHFPDGAVLESYNFPYNPGSSEESVGDLRLRQFAKHMI